MNGPESGKDEKLREDRQLSGEELKRLADQMLASTDPIEIKRLKKEIERGFYGDPVDA